MKKMAKAAPKKGRAEMKRRDNEDEKRLIKKAVKKKIEK